MYNFIVSDNLKSILTKLSKRDKSTYNNILEKIEEVTRSENINTF